MKLNLSKSLLSLCIAVSLASVANVAEARHCQWVKGFWSHGHYHHAHKICWGHRRHCLWENGHKNCYY